MEYKTCLVLLVVTLTTTLSTLSAESKNWTAIDKQDEPYVKAVYAGQYQNARKQITDIDESNDFVQLFNYAVIHDITFLLEYCKECGTVDMRKFHPEMSEGTVIGLIEENEFNRSTAVHYYHKAQQAGHPYAGYMKRRSSLVSGEPLLNRRQITVILNDLEAQAETGDAVATFMYHYLNRDLIILDDAADWLITKNMEFIAKTRQRLETEAHEGRILAMFYLGILHRLQNEHDKAFAWFYLSDKLNFRMSAWYGQDTLSRLKSKSDQEQAVNNLKNIINKMTN